MAFKQGQIIDTGKYEIVFEIPWSDDKIEIRASLMKELGMIPPEIERKMRIVKINKTKLEIE